MIETRTSENFLQTKEKGSRLLIAIDTLWSDMPWKESRSSRNKLNTSTL